MFQPASIFPSVDRPPRGWLVGAVLLLLALEILLLAELDAAPVVLLACLGLFGWLLIASRVEWALAVLAVGVPLFDPIAIGWNGERPIFYFLRLALITSIAFYFFARIRTPGRFAARLLQDRIVLLALLFGVVLTLGSIWTASPNYARMKLIHYGGTHLLLLLGGFVVADRDPDENSGAHDARFDRFLRAVCLLAFLIAIAGLINLRIGFYPLRTRIAFLGLNPIWVARTTGLGIFALLFLARSRTIGPLAGLLIASPLVAVFILAGSRGPTFGLALILFIWVYRQVGSSWSKWLGLPLLGVAAAACTLLIMPEPIRERFLQPITGDFSVAVRLGLVRVAREAFEQLPSLGIGTGGFSQLVRMGDLRAYPHNILAEITIENGIPGLVSLILFLGSVLFRGIRAGTDPRTTAILLAFLYSLWNAQFSGDLISNEWIWLFAGLMAGRVR